MSKEYNTNQNKANGKIMKYVVSDEFGWPIMIVGASASIELMAQSESEELVRPQNAHYRLINSVREETILRSVMDRMNRGKEKILESHKRIDPNNSFKNSQNHTQIRSGN